MQEQLNAALEEVQVCVALSGLQIDIDLSKWDLGYHMPRGDLKTQGWDVTTCSIFRGTYWTL